MPVGLAAAGGDNPMANNMNAATEYVATHRPASLAWGPVRTRVRQLAGYVYRRAHQHLPIRWFGAKLRLVLEKDLSS